MLPLKFLFLQKNTFLFLSILNESFLNFVMNDLINCFEKLDVSLNKSIFKMRIFWKKMEFFKYQKIEFLKIHETRKPRTWLEFKIEKPKRIQGL